MSTCTKPVDTGCAPSMSSSTAALLAFGSNSGLSSASRSSVPGAMAAANSSSSVRTWSTADWASAASYRASAYVAATLIRPSAAR